MADLNTFHIHIIDKQRHNFGYIIQSSHAHRDKYICVFHFSHGLFTYYLSFNKSPGTIYYANKDIIESNPTN